MALTEREKTRAAEDYVNARIGFWIHFAVYIAVMALLVTLDWRDGGGWWAYWPALGWGLGIAGHALGVFGRTPRAWANWRARRIDEARRRL